MNAHKSFIILITWRYPSANVLIPSVNCRNDALVDLNHCLRRPTTGIDSGNFTEWLNNWETKKNDKKETQSDETHRLKVSILNSTLGSLTPEGYKDKNNQIEIKGVARTTYLPQLDGKYVSKDL